MKISIIAAVADNGVIGRAGDVPWDLKDDRRRFAKLTMAHTMIVGRKTHESIVKRLKGPLMDRTTIVLSRQEGYQAAGCHVAKSWEDGLRLVPPREKEIFVIGGAEIYREGLQYATRAYMTWVHAPDIEGDTYFPEVDQLKLKLNWRPVIGSSKFCPQDERNEFASDYEVLERGEGSE